MAQTEQSGASFATIDDIPENIGCNPNCPAGRQIAADIKGDARISGNLALANTIVTEANQFLEVKPCRHLGDGQCCLVEYLSGSNIAARIILDDLGIDASDYIEENYGRKEI